MWSFVIFSDHGCTRFKWTMRIMGFILLFLLGICNAVGTPRFPPRIIVF